jgi:quercetin dioxygenase-like cupin family protein
MKTVMMCAALVGACATAGIAQQAPEQLKRTVMQKIDYPGDKISTVLVLIEVEPNFLVVKHTHPGVETGYILDGELEIAVDGQPPRTLKPGESYLTAPAVAHTAKSGPRGAKVIATFVVDKDKPIAAAIP